MATVGEDAWDRGAPMTDELLERETEVAVLRDLLAEAAGGDGSLLLVEGAAGIGKSGLLRAALAMARDAGFQTGVARASELEREFAFGLVQQLYGPKLASLPPRERAQMFAGAAEFAKPLFEAVDANQLTARGEASHATLHGLYWLTANLVDKRPLALIVDDAHWADPPSLRFLAYLMNRVEELPVLLVVGTRPDEPGAEDELLDELASSPSSRVLQPAPLTALAVDSMVRLAFGPDPDRSFSEACFEATKGNPLYVSELLVTLTVEGLTPSALEAGRVFDIAPRSVARSVARRMRRLPSEAGELAQALAVLGDGSQRAAAATLAGLDEQSADRACEALALGGIITLDPVEFVHPVVRAAIYAELSGVQRARQHQTAARVLTEAGADEDEIALHLLPSEPSGDAQTVEVMRRAARRAYARGAPDVAANYLQRALAEPPPAEEQVELLVELGLAEIGAVRASGFTRAQEAMELAKDPSARARIALELGKAQLSWGNLPEAARVLGEALDQLGGDDPELAQKLEAQLFLACMPVPALAQRVIERCQSLWEQRAELTDPTLLTVLSSFTVHVFAPASHGADLVEVALATGQVSVEEQPATVALAGIGLMAADRLEEAEALWDRALEDAHRLGSRFLGGMVITLRALGLVRVGRIVEADSDARRIFQGLGEDSRLALTIPWLLTTLIEVAIERGELDEASTLLDEHGLTGELPDIYQTNELLATRGRLRVAQGRLGEGISDLRECGRRIEGWLAGTSWAIRNPGLISWRTSLAPALSVAGDREEAIALAHQEVELAREFEIPRELGMALRAAGLAEGGTAGTQLLREAVSVLERTPARLEYARALTDLGAALRREGQRSDAREPLRSGLALAEECGATALSERAHSELVAAGARPRRLVLSGVDALTASERRVAERAASGLSNREIAQALYVTEKTVEGHLGNAYRKLDIGSRSELPRALASSAQTAPS